MGFGTTFGDSSWGSGREKGKWHEVDYVGSATDSGTMYVYDEEYRDPLPEMTDKDIEKELCDRIGNLESRNRKGHKENSDLRTEIKTLEKELNEYIEKMKNSKDLTDFLHDQVNDLTKELISAKKKIEDLNKFNRFDIMELDDE